VTAERQGNGKLILGGEADIGTAGNPKGVAARLWIKAFFADGFESGNTLAWPAESP
jgi:hypothetical protein